MAKITVQELHNEIAHALGKLSDLFVPGMKLSFMARLPGNGEADVLVGDDHDADEMTALINRRFGAPSSAPTAGSIDTPEFRRLIGVVAYGNHHTAIAALIAHIDTWAARSAGEAVRAVVRDALDIALDLAVAEADNVHTIYAGYKPHKHIAVDEDVATIRRAIEAIGAAPAPGNTESAGG